MGFGMWVEQRRGEGMCVASRTRKEKRKGGGDVAEVGSVEPVAAGQCHGGGGGELPNAERRSEQ